MWVGATRPHISGMNTACMLLHHDASLEGRCGVVCQAAPTSTEGMRQCQYMNTYTARQCATRHTAQVESKRITTLVLSSFTALAMRSGTQRSKRQPMRSPTGSIRSPDFPSDQMALVESG